MSRTKKILFLAKTRLRFTNILTSIYLSLVDMGYYVREVDVLQHPQILSNPKGLQGGLGPVEVKFEYIQQEINTFQPDMILFAAGGLTFSSEVSARLQERGIVLLGLTLSDPDVFDAAKTYAGRYSWHTTNSKASLEEYKKLGFTNTFYMPFAIDSRFFVPTEIVPQYKCDVTIIGHHQPSRIPITDELLKRFDTKVFGSRWPYGRTHPVAFPEWLNVVHSGKIVVDFPQTRAGYYNVKIRLFEVAAAGTMLITQHLDEIGEFFEYDKEIVGYSSLDEMYDKISYYLNNPEKRQVIANNAQIRCAKDHMWQHRFANLFEQISF